MTHTFIKKAAVFTLLTFTLMIISANYSFAAKDKAVNLKEAEELYEDGNYNSALEIVDKFIATHSGKGKKFKNELCIAYLIKAKIYYDFENITEMDAALRELFGINIYYDLENEKPDFIKKAKEVRKIVLAEKQRLIEHEGLRRKKKFPVLLVGGVVLTAAAIAIILSLKKKKTKMYTLDVSRGEGIEGSPNSGSSSYKEGTTISYNYTLQGGYTDLVVTLDGQAAAAGGNITMDRDHTLIAYASRITTQYTLTVNKGQGVNGIPESGNYTYYEGTPVNYSYSIQEGYTNLAVTLDGISVSASGTITMNSNHILAASATIIGDNPPTVQITNPSDGETVSGTVAIRANVSDDKGIDRVEFYIDGSIIHTKKERPFNAQWNTTTYSNGHHKIKVIAYDTENQPSEKEITVTVNNVIPPKYVLVVTVGNGAAGTPATGTYEYNEGAEITYSYSANTGYKITSVKLDGSEVATTGTIVMNKDHSLVVTTTTAALK